MLKKFINFIRKPYVIVSVLFIVWVFFFDRNNVIDQYQRRSEFKKLEDQNNYYKTEIEKLRKEKIELFTNKKTLEKFAREKYLMKKDNEEVYIIVDTTEGK